MFRQIKNAIAVWGSIIAAILSLYSNSDKIERMAGWGSWLTGIASGANQAIAERISRLTGITIWSGLITLIAFWVALSILALAIRSRWKFALHDEGSSRREFLEARALRRVYRGDLYPPIYGIRNSYISEIGLLVIYSYLFYSSALSLDALDSKTLTIQIIIGVVLLYAGRFYFMDIERRLVRSFVDLSSSPPPMDQLEKWTADRGGRQQNSDFKTLPAEWSQYLIRTAAIYEVISDFRRSIWIVVGGVMLLSAMTYISNNGLHIDPPTISESLLSISSFFNSLGQAMFPSWQIGLTSVGIGFGLSVLLNNPFSDRYLGVAIKEFSEEHGIWFMLVVPIGIATYLGRPDVIEAPFKSFVPAVVGWFAPIILFYLLSDRSRGRTNVSPEAPLDRQSPRERSPTPKQAKSKRKPSA